MAGADEGSRICDVVRDSKIQWDIPLKSDLKFDSFVPEPNRYSDGLRHKFYNDAQLVDGDFPRITMAEVSGGYHHLKGTATEGNKSWFRPILPHFDGCSLKLDFLDWIDTIEDYFEATNPPEAVKCKVAASTLKGEALKWWKELQNHRFLEGKNSINTWPRMRKLLIKEFLHTSRLTYFYKQENENDVKHTNCLKKVPIETYINEQDWVCDSSSFGVSAGMSYGNINDGILEGSTLPKPNTGGTIGHSQLKAFGDKVLVVQPSDTIEHQTIEVLKVEESMGKVQKGDMHRENDQVCVKEMIEENFTSGNRSTKFLSRLSKLSQEEEEVVKQLMVNDFTHNKCLIEVPLQSVNNKEDQRDVDLEDLEGKTHVKSQPLVVTQELSTKEDDTQSVLLFDAFNKDGFFLRQPQSNGAQSVFLPVANSDHHLQKMINGKMKKVKDSDKQEEILMLNFDPGGKWKHKLSMDNGQGRVLQQDISSFQYSNINIKKEEQSRVSHAFNRVIDVCDFEVCRQWFNNAVKWCCLPLQLGLNAFPLLTPLAHMTNFVDMAENGALQSVRITDVLIYMENIPIWVVFGDLNVVVYASEVVGKIFSTSNSWMFETCGALGHPVFGKDTRGKVIANMRRGMVNNRVQSLCVNRFIPLPVMMNHVYRLVERGYCEGRYCSLVRFVVVLRATLVALLAPNFEDPLSFVGNKDVRGVVLFDVLFSMNILSEIEAELAATKGVDPMNSPIFKLNPRLSCERVAWLCLCIARSMWRFVPTSVDAYLTPFIKAYLYRLLLKTNEVAVLLHLFVETVCSDLYLLPTLAIDTYTHLVQFRCLEYLIIIPYMSDAEVFKVCFNYWSSSVSGLFETHDHLDYSVAIADLLSLQVHVVPCWIDDIRPQSLGDEKRNIVRETLVLYKDHDHTESQMLKHLCKQLNGENWMWDRHTSLCWAIGFIVNRLSHYYWPPWGIKPNGLLLQQNWRGKDDAHVFFARALCVIARRDDVLGKHWYCRFYLTHGRVIPREGWSSMNNTYMEMKFNMVEIGVVIVDYSVNAFWMNGQPRESLKLSRNVVNGLDPPMSIFDGASEAFGIELSATSQFFKTFNVKELPPYHHGHLTMHKHERSNSRTSSFSWERMEMMQRSLIICN